MMSGDGMVAVVRGLGETGIAVTVIDGSKQYTLAPTRVQKTEKVQESIKCTEPGTVCCESTVQAVDGRYTSTYQMQHCNVVPTSPPVVTTEFPPQRTNLCPGHGNFEVGGSGSGKTYASANKTGNFKGAMNWPDRGCVCSPRASHEVDAFASSLRKYPTSSPEKSSEIVEKIVNYALEKNGLKNQLSSQHPTRLSESDTLDPRIPSKVRPSHLVSRRMDASPTRMKNDDYSFKELRFPKEYDIRFLRNISKRARESAKNASANRTTHVNSEIQAAVKMVSREVSTVPTSKPARRTIAVPLSPSPSTAYFEGEYCCTSRHSSIQTTLKLNVGCTKPVQAVSSCVELDERDLSVLDNLVKTRSQENIRNSNSNHLKNDIELVEDVSMLSTKTKDFINQTAKRESEFLKNINLDLCKNLIRVLECDLIDILTHIIGCLRSGKDSEVKDEIKYKECDQLTEEQADATHLFINNLRELLKKSSISNKCIVHSSSIHSIHNTNSLSSKNNENHYLDGYTQLISQELEEWLENLNLSNTEDASLKQDIKKRLTLDIVDRYKYLESKPSKRSPDSNEIEHLKFEIYKCMNKLVGESYTEILQHAEELLTKIRCLPVPVTRTSQKAKCSEDNTHFRSSSTHSCHTQSEGGVQEIHNGCTHKSEQYNGILDNGKRKEAANKNNEISNYKSGKSPRKKWKYLDTDPELTQCKNASWPLATPTILSDNFTGVPKNMPSIDFSQKQLVFRIGNEQTKASYYEENQSNNTLSLKELNEEYDGFIKEWVQKLPILVTNAEEQKLAELARLGIFNGIWKAVTKLNLDPNACNNSYYYQDVLDDEIEDLLSNLPQTTEFVAIKHRLKAELLEKTRSMNEKIKGIILPSCFKQRLMESLDIYLPKTSIFDPLKEKINVHKLSLIEDYILLIRYIDEDDAKSNMYKNSLLKKIMELANINKENHAEKHIDNLNYVSKFVNALSKVPIPDRKKLEEVVNEILLGNEVNGWLSALPLCDDVDVIEIRRYRNKVVKKILEIEEQQNLLNSSAQAKLREDIRKQLRRISLHANDMNSVIEELLNTLKKIPKIQESRHHYQEESEPYEDFRRSVPGCSTFMHVPEASEDGSSYMVVGGDIVKRSTPKYLQPFKEPTISEENWLSMELTQRPPKLGWSRTQVTGPKEQLNGPPHTSAGNSQSVFGQNPVDTNCPREFSNFPGQTLSQPYEYGQNIESNNKAMKPWNDIINQNYKTDPFSKTWPSPSYGQPYVQERQQRRYGSLPYNQPLHNYQDVRTEDKIKHSSVMSCPNGQPSIMSRSETVIDNADIRRFILDKSTQPSSTIKSSPVHSILPARLSPETSDMVITSKTDIPPTAGVNDIFRTSKVARPSEVRQQSNVKNPELSWFRARKGSEEHIDDIQRQVHSWDTNNRTSYPRNSTTNGRNYPFENFESILPSYTGQPIGFSTPQQPIIQEEPVRPRKRYQARRDSFRSNSVRRKLELEDSDYNSDSEGEELSCFCKRRHCTEKSCIRIIPSCEDLYLAIPHCVSDRMISCPHFY